MPNPLLTKLPFSAETMNLNLKAQSANTYDAIVVGSGISGGWAAMELTKKGLKVLLLERGRNVEHVKDYHTALKNTWEFEHRGQKTNHDREHYGLQMRNYGVDETNRHFYVDEKESPYVQTKNETFVWARGHQVGGRSLTWGRQCYRWSDLDFEANAKESIGVDWPIRYKDIAPWYTYAEKFVGISGSRENIAHLPDGEFLPPMQMNCAEKHVSHQIEKTYPDRRMIIGRVANLTEAKAGRGVCQFRNLCERGCPFGGYFSTNSATLPAAIATGNLTLRPHSIVLSVLYDEAKQKARGVTVLDAETNQTHEYFAKVIFLNASTVSTAAILLNSVSNRFPNGLGNDSGELGHNLMMHFKTGASGVLEGFADKYHFGRRANGIYVPRFRNVREKHPGFLRGYNYQGGAGRGRNHAEGFGAEWKEQAAQPSGNWNMGLVGFGEQLPDHDNKVSLSKTVTDKWGVAVPEIGFEWKENELEMAKDTVAQSMEMLTAAGLKDVRMNFGLPMPLSTVHEMGTARMGRDPKTSLLNAHNQMHAVKNVFITDGSCMTSASSVNPSITYMALTARACEYAVDEMRNSTL